jgi:hypothetical protein
VVSDKLKVKIFDKRAINERSLRKPTRLSGNQLELTSHQHKIGRFQIRVYDLFFMDDMYSLKHLRKKEVSECIKLIYMKSPAASNKPPKPC